MRVKNIIITIAAEPVPTEGLAHSIPCQVVQARCIIDDPKYETWSIGYIENSDTTTEVVGTPATLVTRGQHAQLYWNNEVWKTVATPVAQRVLSMMKAVKAVKEVQRQQTTGQSPPTADRPEEPVCGK